MRWLKYLIIVMLCVIALVVGIGFAWLNTDDVVIDLFFVTLPEASLSLWLMASFVLGGFAGILATGVGMMLLRARLNAAQRKVNAANQELDRLRTASLKQSA